MATIRLDAPNTDLLDALTNDILWILISAYVIRRRSRLEGLQDWSAQHLAEEFFLLEAAQRDLILRLTALDDDGRGQRSFRSVMKVLKAQDDLYGPAQAEADKAVKAYRALINTMKTKHRNAYIGHVLDGETATPRLPQAPEALNEAIASAVAIGDQLTGVRQSYLFKMTGGQRLDLREELGL